MMNMKIVFGTLILASLSLAACEKKPAGSDAQSMNPSGSVKHEGDLGQAGATGASGGQSTTTQGMNPDGSPTTQDATCPPGSTAAQCAKDAPSGPTNKATEDRDHQQNN